MTDFLILGGGSAGCVLAARLSETPARSVVLVEAGADLRPGAVPPEISSSYPGRAFLSPRFIWPALTALTGGAARNDPATRPRPRYEQGRLLGGGSAVNAMVAYRGAPEDYDEWGEMGAEGWSWETALPCFRKLESDADIHDELHGGTGPIPVRRQPQSMWTPMTHAALAALRARGVPYLPDMNGAWVDGAYPTAVSMDADGHRASVATRYLTDAVRARPNLRIITDTTAERLLVENGQVVGATLRGPAGLSEQRAHEVIVSAGGVHSPALLLRSGIGPGEDLQRLGIEVARALPGVGRNLMEHPSTTLSLWLRRQARMRSNQDHHIFLTWRWSSGVAGAGTGDMHTTFPARSGWHSLGTAIGTVLMCVYKPFSRGSVTLASPDAGASPNVDLQLLADWRDRERLKQSFRQSAAVLLSPEMAGVRDLVFPAVCSDKVKRISAPTPRNAVKTALVATALDAAMGLRTGLIHRHVTEGITLADLLADDSALDAYLTERVGVTWHPSGTCRMGRAEDPMAVTDGAGSVHGVKGLRVVDASIFPSIPRANTNLPTIMLAERMAEVIGAAG